MLRLGIMRMDSTEHYVGFRFTIFSKRKLGDTNKVLCCNAHANLVLCHSLILGLASGETPETS